MTHQSNFYLSINQEWLNNNPIPNDYSSWGSFHVLATETQKQLQEILNDNSNENDNNDWTKVKLLWEKGNDEHTLNQQNITELLSKYVMQIININKLTELYDFLFNNYVCSGPFDIDVSADLEESNTNVIYLDCCGLGLPDRDMYFLKEMENKRDKYLKYLNILKQYIETNFELKKKIDIKNIYNLEVILAQNRLTRTERRDPKKIYNQYTLFELNELMPCINWSQYLTYLNIDVTQIKYLVVSEPEYFKKLNTLFEKEINLDIWKEYLLIQLFKFASSYTNNILNQINFDFYGKALSGQLEQKPKWKRVLGVIDSYVGELLGKKYITKHFPETSKQIILDMINKMKTKLAERINNLTWMTDKTKIKALSKLNKINTKIGYPDKWEDFRDLVLNIDDTYFELIVKCNQWLTNKNLQKYNKPVDKNEWHMTPHTINAYYDPTKNEIVFPAAILQEPFFNPNNSLASNYGGIGAVICHEITHGFDDQGCQFDEDGNLNNWWTEEDKISFDKASKKLEEQFNQYIIEEMNINGKLTLGENIADLGGVTITLDCLKDYLKNNNSIDYKTELKNFFIQWAIIWRNNIRPDESKQRILTDPHSPGCLRVNGILKNISDFYDIFDINNTDEMFLDITNRCLIW